jgi:hypothetical protein
VWINVSYVCVMPFHQQDILGICVKNEQKNINISHQGRSELPSESVDSNFYYSGDCDFMASHVSN